MLTPPPTFQTKDVGRTRLDNGLSVLTREIHSIPTVATMIWYRVGSRNEVAGGTGRSHFLEHMLFKGTRRYARGEIDQLTMKNGGSNNAFTSADFTAYYFNFAADRWSNAVEIEADRMVHTLFDPAEFEAERNVVIEELRAGLDQPWGRLMRDTNRTAFERHPYGNPVIGWLEDVETASVADMENYYRQHYCPSNATLVVVGDFTTSEVLDSVEREFGGIAAGERAAPTPDPEPPQTGERRFASSWPSDVSRLAIAFHAPAVGHPDSYALQLLAAILADGKASRLYQRLVEGDRSATFVSADYSETLDDTLFYIRAETRGRGSRGGLEAAIFEEVDRIAREGVAGRDLERARHQIEAHYVFSMERPLDQAMLLGQIETLTTLAYIDRYMEHVARVDSDRVRDVCSRYLREANRTVGWLVGDRAGGETP